jgi:hypothetical protein
MDNEKFNILERIDVERIIDNKIEQDSCDGKFLVVCSFYNNTKEHILRTFDNMLNQTHKNWILIVGDDFSTNGCGEMLKDEVSRINHPNILYYDVKFKRELHLCQNFFKTINYDYFVELDADDYVSNNLLEIYNNHFNKYPNVFSIFCDYNVVSEDGGLERISFIRNSDLDIDDEFYDRDSSSYMGIWKKYHSWNMYGHARCFRKSKRSRFLIDKNCKSSADTFSLFSCLQEGDHLLLPRDLYKLVNRKGSDSGSPMSQEEVLYYNTNSLLAIKEYSKKKQYKVLDLYEDIWLETSALSSSYLVKEKSEINLISDINEEQLSKIKDLYPDKIISVNDPTVNNVVVVWNKLDFHQRHSVLSILRDKSINFSIYNFIDSFDVSEEDMKEYLDNETNDLLGTVRKYIGGHSYFSYFRHVIISGRAI